MRKNIDRVYDFSRELARLRIGIYASSAAFYIFLSLVPIVVVMCSILPLTHLTQADLLEFLGMYLPDYMDNLITGVIGDVYGASKAILPLSAVMALWSAGMAFSALIRGVEEAYDDPHRDSYFRRRIRAMIFTVAALLLLLVSVAVMIFGGRAEVYLIQLWPESEQLLSMLIYLRYPICIVILTFAFTLMFTIIPSYKLKLFAQVPGAAFASAVWVGFTYVFSYYIKHMGGYSTYGSLSTIVVAMLWLYYGMYFILLGAYINFFWDTRLRGARHSRIRTQRLY